MYDLCKPDFFWIGMLKYRIHKNEEKKFRIAATWIAPSGEALDKANVISFYYICFGLNKSLANIIMMKPMMRYIKILINFMEMKFIV